jgi:hypothetical protein
MALIVSPGTQTALGKRDASSRPTVVLPAAGTPEITKSAMFQPYAVPRPATSFGSLIAGLPQAEAGDGAGRRLR